MASLFRYAYSEAGSYVDIVRSLTTRVRSNSLSGNSSYDNTALLRPNSKLCPKPLRTVALALKRRDHFEISFLYPGNRIIEEVSEAGTCNKVLVQSLGTRLCGNSLSVKRKRNCTALLWTNSKTTSEVLNNITVRDYMHPYKQTQFRIFRSVTVARH